MLIFDSMLIFGHNSPASGRYKLIALTNNFSRTDVPQEERRFLGWDDGATPTHLRELFDDFCDSSSLGMRFVAIPSAVEPKLMERICMTENRNMAFTYLLASEMGSHHWRPSFSMTLACESFPRFVR